MSRIIHFRVGQLQTGESIRLDRFVAERMPELTRSYIKKLINDGMIVVDNAPTKPSYHLKAFTAVTVRLPDPKPVQLVPQYMPLKIVYEDNSLLVVDKEAGITVHPGPGHPDSTLANAILSHCPDLGGIGGSIRPGIVHRLDKDTSGLIMIAKNDHAHLGLSQQIKNRSVAKKYLALVNGIVIADRASIEAPIGRDPNNRKRMAIVSTGREAQTKIHVLERLQEHTLVEATLVTGRTHQIRVHLASTGHPITGDVQYGGRSHLLNRQFLHSCALGFHHPLTGETINCTSPLPEDLSNTLTTLRQAALVDIEQEWEL